MKKYEILQTEPHLEKKFPHPTMRIRFFPVSFRKKLVKYEKQGKKYEEIG